MQAVEEAGEGRLLILNEYSSPSCGCVLLASSVVYYLYTPFGLGRQLPQYELLSSFNKKVGNGASYRYALARLGRVPRCTLPSD